MRLDIAIRELAAGQHSCIATWQLRALGASTTEVSRLRHSHNWNELTTRVLGLLGAPPSDRRLLMAAVLDASPGASIGREAAAALWGLPGYRIHPVHVVRHRGISRQPSDLAIVHEVVDLLPQHIKILDGIPLTSPARVICELAATQRPRRVETNLDWFWTERLLDGMTFRRTVAELAGRGRKGSALLKALDAERGPGYVPLASGLERRFEEVMRFNGEPPMRRQVDIGSIEEWCGRVDFKDSSLPLIIEVQSEKHHSSLVDRAADTARRAKLEAAGNVVREVWDTDLWHNPDRVIEIVRSGRSEARAVATRRTRAESDTDVCGIHRGFVVGPGVAGRP